MNLCIHNMFDYIQLLHCDQNFWWTCNVLVEVLGGKGVCLTPSAASSIKRAFHNILIHGSLSSTLK